MADLLSYLEVAIGVLVGLGLGFLVLLFVRRRTIGRGRLLTLSGIRFPARPRWRMGLVGFGSGEIQWYTLSGLTLRPRFRWARAGLELGAPRRSASEAGLDGLEDAVVVPCRHHGTDFDLALPAAAYTALRSWVESGPPRSAGSVG